jgi:HlyD family secretion protein
MSIQPLEDFLKNWQKKAISISMKISVISKRKKIYPWVLGVITIGALGTAFVVKLSTSRSSSEKDLTKQTIIVKSTSWEMQIQASGVVQAEKKINLSPENSGKVAQLYVNEGDNVHQGQIIARMTSDRIEAQVAQYKALVLKAEADFDQKRSGNRPEEIGLFRARLARAEADLKQLEDTNQEEINQAEAQLKVTKARTELTKIQLDRNQKLVQDNVISRDKLDEARTNYKTTSLSQEEAQKKVQQLRNSKKQELVQRQAGLKEAQQGLTQVKNGPRPKEILQAEAEVKQAKAQLAFYQAQFNDTIIRAPFPGIITRRFAQEGDFVTPTTTASATEGATSTSIAELSSGLEIAAKIPEANISRINPGQLVDIKTDTYPEEIFQGKAKLIAPRAVQENNVTSFRVKVVLVTGQNKLKSGMNVQLAFHTKPIPNALVIPLSAVVTQPSGDTGVYVPTENGETRFQAIKISVASGDKVQVIEGLKSGDRILNAPPSEMTIEGVDS